MTGVYCGTGAHDKCAHPRCDCICHRPAPAAPETPSKPSEVPTMTTQTLECPDCGQTCASAQGLGVHRTRAHTRSASPATPSPPATFPAPQRDWVCDDCGRTFASAAALGGHRNAHTPRPTPLTPDDVPSLARLAAADSAGITPDPDDRPVPPGAAAVALVVHRDVVDLAAALAFLDGTTLTVQFTEALSAWAARTLADDPDLRTLVQARQARRSRTTSESPAT